MQDGVEWDALKTGEQPVDDGESGTEEHGKIDPSSKNHPGRQTEVEEQESLLLWSSG